MSFWQFARLMRPKRPVSSLSRLTASCVVALVLLCTARPDHAQAQETTPQLETTRAGGTHVQGGGRASIAEHWVTLSLKDVTLETALLAIGRAAGVSIAYGDLIVPLQRHVSLDANRMPVMVALRTVLAGTPVQVKVSAEGKLALSYDAGAAADSLFGRITGRVTETETGKPVAHAQVAIEGTHSVTTTDQDGAYTFARVPAGRYMVTARVLGYGAARLLVTVPENGAATANLTLSAIPTRLQELVTTGSGDRAKYEVGNSIATINADSVTRTTPIRNISDLLQSRAPGVQVLSTSGTVGSGSRVRIRGISSILTNSDPIVIIDGVRADAVNSASAGAGSTLTSVGQNTVSNAPVPAMSRLNDIDPEMIETIEVLKGPSASTLYGSDAANGVIVIKTKRGKPGATLWSFSTTQGMSRMDATFMDAWRAWGESTSQPALTQCTLALIAADVCTQDSVTHYNPLNHSETTPFGTGQSHMYMGQVSGGYSQLRYFLGGTYDDETGILKMPDAEAAQLVTMRNGVPLPGWAKRPNVLSGGHLNANLTADLNPKMDVALNLASVNESHRDAGQGYNGFVTQSYLSSGYRDTLGLGWGTSLPGIQFLTRNGDTEQRLTGGLTGNVRPMSFLSGHGTFGLDQSTRVDETLLRTTDVVQSGTSQRGRSDMETTVKTADIGATMTLPLASKLQWRSSIGGQYTRQDEQGSTLQGYDLPAGSEILTTASTIFAYEATSANATAGWYVDEGLAYDERLFLTAAVRGDAGSSFGRSARTLTYPKFSASWLLSQESFFPKNPVLTNTRLRFAFGQAGVQPSVDARFRSYTAGSGFLDGATVTDILVSTVGNTKLEPERSAEYEGGADFGFWDDRVTVEWTSYYKYTRNALVQRDLPPSVGLPSRQENIGNVSNSGVEVSTTLRPIITPLMDWSATIGLSKNANKLVKLGNSSMTTLTSQQTRYVEGYPINGFWARGLLGYQDLDGNGIISANEIQLTDSAIYVGQPLPKLEMSFHNNFAFWQGRLTVAAGFSYNSGATQYNTALWDQCGSSLCRGVIDPTISLSQQAAALSGTNSTVFYGSYEHVSWVRWNDLSVTVMAPRSIVRLLRGRTATLSLMGRNLALWSNYRGADPEVNTLPIGNSTQDGGGIPQPRDWSLRINVDY